jgi:hypothetical protein
MALADVLQAIREQPLLHDLHLEQLTTFIRLAAHLKCDILLPQPLAQTTDSAPDVLPEAVVIFLSLAIGIPLLAVEPLWDLLKNDVWDSPPIRGLVSEEDEDLYRLYGWQLGLSKSPESSCTHPHLTHTLPSCAYFISAQSDVYKSGMLARDPAEERTAAPSCLLHHGKGCPSCMVDSPILPR